jgi:glycosyltransferase involved in cell wall biosynthesis
MVKILLVSHNYPPAHVGGTEQYTAQLARGLRRRGYEVCVFTTEKDIRRKHLSLEQREHHGVPVFELVNNLEYTDFRESWDHPQIAQLFRSFLERERPDLVHFQHLLYLSVGCAEVAKDMGLPVVFTLHDYWLQCARFGQRVHADKTICHEITEQRCAECLGSFRFRNSAMEQRAGRWIERAHRVTGVDLSKPARWAGDLLRGKEQGQAAPSLALDKVQQRVMELTPRLSACVDRFLSPSAFLRDQLVEWGLPADKFDHLRTGTELERFAPGKRTRRGGKLRLGFIGSLIPVKGAHLLLEAIGLLSSEQRSRMTAQVFGPSFHDAAYQADLEQQAKEVGVELGGSLDRDEVAATLRRLDLLVVPSVWFENQPLIILEALAAQTPLAVSDLGGMAELVKPGESGFRFPMGDVGALAKLLGDLSEDPSPLDALYSKAIAIPSVGDQLDAIERVYRDLGQTLEPR